MGRFCRDVDLQSDIYENKQYLCATFVWLPLQDMNSVATVK
jgi:hypothetical protein